MYRSLFAALITSFVSILFVGCQSYQLGSPTELNFDSIYVTPASNDSFAPQAQALLSGQVRQHFISDGRLQVVSNPELADVILNVNIIDYSRETASRESDDTFIAQDFDIELVSEIALFDNRSQKYLFEKRRVQDVSNAFVDNPYREEDQLAVQGFLQAEYQAIPRLTRDMARKIADEVLSPW